MWVKVEYMCGVVILYKAGKSFEKVLDAAAAPSSSSNFFNYFGPAWRRAKHTRDIFALPTAFVLENIDKI